MYIFENYTLLDLDPDLKPFIGKKERLIYSLEVHNYYIS